MKTHAERAMHLGTVSGTLVIRYNLFTASFGDYMNEMINSKLILFILSRCVAYIE